MSLPDIFLLAALLLLLRLLPRGNPRRIGLICLSVLFCFYFQAPLSVRGFDYWLPALIPLLTLGSYAICGGPDALRQRRDFLDAGLILLLLLLPPFFRLLGIPAIFTATAPPLFYKAVIFCLIAGSLMLLGARRYALTLLLLGLLVCLKTPFLSLQLSRFCRVLAGQSPENALSTDLQWFGFSYAAFRLLSVLIDSRKGHRVNGNLGDLLIYVCFPPALAAGPIDRYDRFCKDLNADNAPDLMGALERIALGTFRKFVLADTLALFALSARNAARIRSSGYAWLLLFAYGLRLYFDFAGCSDIAIGLGLLCGVHLPENFSHPYLKGNPSTFWSAWHISLTQWVRAYVFNPLTRALRARKNLPKWLIVLSGQLTVMLLIGLWHGVSVNFALWGLWHALGTFTHQLYSQSTGAALRRLKSAKPALYQAYCVLGCLCTLIYVMLGWVWFVIPDTVTALRFFALLFGRVE